MSLSALRSWAQKIGPEGYDRALVDAVIELDERTKTQAEQGKVFDKLRGVPSPEEFRDKVAAILRDTPHDAEVTHGETDTLMEDLLVTLGYGEGINLIRGSDRWYA